MGHIPALDILSFAQYSLSTVIKNYSLQGLPHRYTPIDFSVVKYSFFFPSMELNGLYN